ncbi:speckle targeted PIP5K1A-regulated poly(A) polymerase-like [Bradysia coprophila]|uniref:speckle targeted PIP5K1A-regulated poly(A) polymerase-like n=1 Tax=Bradysia coprophila TaxID=38358 RepID=UPI00187DD2DC|nr:speckle targeted PIP5K1A-regulated poly(A) polymerase-like [Bradysia coprophila]
MPKSQDATSDKEKKKSEIKEKKTKIEDPADEALESMQKAVRSELMNCKVGEELETLVRTLLHNVQRHQVEKDVLAAFQHHYPGIFKNDQIRLFGSSVMGIAFKDSDLDFYVELPNREQHKSNLSRIKIIREILESTKKFANLQSITRPRVPIVKGTHIATLTNCDFNCSNRFGSLNSPIVAHLVTFDDRIHKLAVIIKYWMKIHDCSGVKRISNYAVVWMLIFYLQTLPKPIVPPIDEFQRNVPPSMVSHFNFAFDYSMPNKTENESPWSELLLGFFKFYRDFDYGSQLICPLYGKTLSKADVYENKIIELERYRQILLADRSESPMDLGKHRHSLCIQDPFDLMHKIPGDILTENFERIVWKIGYAAEIVECELQKGETRSMFLRIFDVDQFDRYANVKELERRSQAKQRNLEQQAKEAMMLAEQAEQNEYLSIVSVLSKNAQNGHTVTMQLTPTNYILNISQYDAWKIVTNNCDVQIDGQSIRKVWAKEVIEMIADILRYIFCLDVYDVQSSDEFVKKFDLVGARDVFANRKQKSFNDNAWEMEALDSSNRFDRSTYIPLEVSVKITAGAVNFDCVSIEFNDEIKTRSKNFYRLFRQEFFDRIDYLLKIYFLHRIEMAKSDIANADQAKDQGCM